MSITPSQIRLTMASVMDKAFQREGATDRDTSSSEHPADWSPPLNRPNQGTDDPHFLRIPIEIMDYIVNTLDRASLGSLTKTCRACYNVANPILCKNDTKLEFSSSLFWGAACGVLNTVKLSHDAGADLNYKGHVPWMEDGYRILKQSNIDGASAIHWAARYNHPDIVKWLLGQDVDMNIPSTGECFWKYETDKSHPRRRNAPPYRRPPLGWPPVHDSLSQRNLRCSRLLINRGTSLSLSLEATDGGHTALHPAAARGLLSIIDLLDRNSLIGDGNSRDWRGNTVLHHVAASLRQKTNSPVIPQTLHKLLSLGADL